MGTLFRSATTAFCIAAAIQCFTVGYLAPRFPLQVCRPFVAEEQELTFAPTPDVYIDNRDGAIQVMVHDETQILVSARIRAYAQDTQTQEVAKEYVRSLLKTERTDSALRLLSEPGNRPDNVELGVDYKITVPPDTNIHVRGSKGNVTILAGCGSVSVESNNADVEVLGAGGSVTAKVANGRISVQDARAETVLETVNGSIYAQMTGGSLQASTANGNISGQVLGPDVTAINLTAMNGGITLVVSEECSAEVHATTDGGEVRSDIPLTAMNGVQKRREIHGMWGDGTTKLTMNSLNGNILITRSTS